VEDAVTQKKTYTGLSSLFESSTKDKTPPFTLSSWNRDKRRENSDLRNPVDQSTRFSARATLSWNRDKERDHEKIWTSFFVLVHRTKKNDLAQTSRQPDLYSCCTLRATWIEIFCYQCEIGASVRAPAHWDWRQPKGCWAVIHQRDATR